MDVTVLLCNLGWRKLNMRCFYNLQIWKGPRQGCSWTPSRWWPTHMVEFWWLFGFRWTCSSITVSRFLCKNPSHSYSTWTSCIFISPDSIRLLDLVGNLIIWMLYLVGKVLDKEGRLREPGLCKVLPPDLYNGQKREMNILQKMQKSGYAHTSCTSRRAFPPRTCHCLWASCTPRPIGQALPT